MTTINDFERVMRTVEEMIDLDVDVEDCKGISTAEIHSFSVDESSSSSIKMEFILPWGEKHTFTKTAYDIVKYDSGWFQNIMDYLGLDLNEFKEARGKKIPVGIRYLKLGEEGNIKTGTKINADVTRALGDSELEITEEVDFEENINDKETKSKSGLLS